MGAYGIRLNLHDAELEAFVRRALAEQYDADAYYIASMLCHHIPELAAAVNQED